MVKTEAEETTEAPVQHAKQARVAAIVARLASHDGAELPPDLQEWLDQFAGRFHLSFPFYSDTYFDRDRDLYDRDE